MSIRVVAAAVAVATGLGAGIAVAAGPASPGDPPTLEFRRCVKDERCTRPLVLASGEAYGYGTEIVGFGRDDPHGRNLCIELDRLYTSRSYPIATLCGSRRAIVHAKPSLSLVFWDGFDSYGHLTHVLGTTKANVGSVRVRYRRDRRWKQAKPIFGVAGDHLAGRIRQRAPFGVFAAAIPRCIDARRIRATAYDDAGHILGRSRFIRPDFAYVCHRRDAAHRARQSATGSRQLGNTTEAAAAAAGCWSPSCSRFDSGGDKLTPPQPIR